MAQFGIKSRRVFGSKGSWWLAVPLTLIAIAALVACTSGKNTVPDKDDNLALPSNRVAYCRFQTDFNSEGKRVDDEQASIALINKFESRFDQALTDAPPEIKPDVQKLLAGLRKVAQANSQEAVASDAEELSDIGKRLNSYCGIPN